MSTRAHHIPYESHLVQASLRTRHARRPLRSFVRVVTRFGRPEVRAAARLRLCRAARLHPSLVCAVCGRGFVKQRPILTPLIAPHLAKARGYLVDARIERAHLGVKGGQLVDKRRAARRFRLWPGHRMGRLRLGLRR